MSGPDALPGPVALVGGAEWNPGCAEFDAHLLERSGGDEVVILPTANAFERPAVAADQAVAHFQALGGRARAVMALTRGDAEDPAFVDQVVGARFVYLGGGSPLHLRSVLKESPLGDAVEAAWRAGGVLAGSSAGAMVLCDPMIDPRGGAFTLGLGLLENLAVLPHYDAATRQRARRSLHLAPRGVPVAGIAEQTALILDQDGWRAEGIGAVTVLLDGEEADLDVLPRL